MLQRFLPTGLALAAALCLAQPAVAACTVGGASGMVTLGSLATTVPNRVLSADCQTVDDAIGDEQPWGSQAAFLTHVSKVSFDLFKAGKLSAAERSRLLSAAQASGVGTTLTVKLIAFNDFHGTLEAGGSNPGVARFATRIAELKAANPLHAVVSAGDMIGASPLVSALFHDEPTMEAMNRIGIDFNAVGNHEFDEGRAELLRMQQGGNHPTDVFSGQGLPADLEGGQFAGADFGFLAANVRDEQTGETLLPGVGIKDFMGTKVAFIGMTLKNTPTIVSPSGVAGLRFQDEADTVNALIPQLKAQGIHSVVVLVHEGGLITAGGINGCTGVSGPIVDIVSRLDAAVDLVISGHTHQAYNCVLPNRAGTPLRVTSAGQYGRVLSNIDLTLDTRTRDVRSITAVNATVPNDASVAEAPALVELVQHYKAEAAVPASRVIGRITATITRTANAAGESALGDVIADAQLDATDDAGFGEAVVAFMNPGGIRADLPFSAAGKADGEVTYGEAFTVQPFGNAMVTLTLTGAQIETLLEQQFTGCTAGYPAGAPATGQPFNRILQVSRGFSYAWNPSGPACDKVPAASIRLNGQPIDPAASYRVTVNSFLADGGDQFYVLRQGGTRLGGAVDTDALEAYLKARPEGVAPGAQDRIQTISAN